ncbi:MAG: type II secretion system F family protein [Campylobacterota bacterium]|nr:type II secretion system F family protein [Campylobacterota bacterium]
MNYDNMMLLFILFTPFLVVTLSYFLFQIYKEMNKQRVIIDTLSDSASHILDTKKKVHDGKKKTNFLREKLNFGGFTNPASEYVFIFISIAFGVLVGIFIYIVMQSLVTLIISALIFSMFPYLVLKKIIANRQEEFNFGLKSVIDKVTSMMKSGVGFEQAFKKSILTTKSQFTREVLGIYINEKDIIGEDKVFEKMFALVESKELRIFYLVISIGRQSGGKFSNTLETLRKTLHDQGVIKQEIVSSTKEIKIGTYIIIFLTITMYLMMNEVFEEALDEHFFGSSEGKLQMFFILVWVGFGIFVNNMMTKIKG